MEAVRDGVETDRLTRALASQHFVRVRGGSTLLPRHSDVPHHEMRLFVTADTAAPNSIPMLIIVEQRWGLKMTAERDIPPLIELLKMAADQWPSSELGEVSQHEMFRRDQALLEMWPEACRRVGAGEREFPIGVIKLWQLEMGRGRVH
jgi:hypothetical protein